MHEYLIDRAWTLSSIKHLNLRVSQSLCDMCVTLREFHVHGTSYFSPCRKKHNRKSNVHSPQNLKSHLIFLTDLIHDLWCSNFYCAKSYKVLDTFNLGYNYFKGTISYWWFKKFIFLSLWNSCIYIQKHLCKVSVRHLKICKRYGFLNHHVALPVFETLKLLFFSYRYIDFGQFGSVHVQKLPKKVGKMGKNT